MIFGKYYFIECIDREKKLKENSSVKHASGGTGLTRWRGHTSGKRNDTSAIIRFNDLIKENDK